MKKLIVVFVILLSSCKAKTVPIPKEIIVSDTLIKHEVDLITLPTNYTTIIKKPCKNDSLIISDQYLKIGKLELKIKNLNGQLAIETDIDSIVDSKVSEIVKHRKKEVIYIPKPVPEPFIPKWVWYVSGTFLTYIIYRILRAFIPALKLLPY